MSASVGILERYLPARQLGVGGIARSFLAVQRSGELRRLVVLKEVRPELSINEEIATEIIDRCRVAGLVDHQNVARMTEVERAGIQIVAITDYVFGDNILAVLARCARLARPAPLQLAVRIIADACAGLAAAYSCSDPLGRVTGLVHGAIRPSNVLISYGGCTKVVDLGLTKLRLPKDNEGVTPAQAHFLAPEMFRGARADTRTDVYSLCVLLYTMLTLRFPHDTTQDTAAVIDAKWTRNVVPPAARSSAIPPDLERIILQGLTLHPDKRQGAAAELQSDLEGYLIRNAATSSARAVADFLESLFSRRIRGKKKALRSLLTMPLDGSVGTDTSVDVIEEEPRLDAVLTNDATSLDAIDDSWDEESTLTEERNFDTPGTVVNPPPESTTMPIPSPVPEPALDRDLALDLDADTTMRSEWDSFSANRHPVAVDVDGEEDTAVGGKPDIDA